ncbi:DUF1249 domain-containing protein [Endozoicomonas sp. GU-1]|uniref:DUF1249 domain-containing protein n=1 Tax=Endozoicomonas sp. GU-1 TaxID=3009078 RepID=UPI0022B46386|nr:DUF1249 domain-containing protein [Endozoicomonas sp. GU-1]WBA80411.1 DUF1249 domain-containing protein [Endozoicomonas sp. GU-1]WBA87975.1 DUF1249 domain-containing protein [Endozoicomonas sp. GU-1]
MKRHSLKPNYRVNLIRLQQVCESNYLRLMRLLPELSDQEHFRLPVKHRNSLASGVEWLVIDVLERSPFTTLLMLQMEADWGQLFNMPKAEVRLYHDVQMAEIVSRKTSQIIQPRYDYPNSKMHQPDEKEQHNQFLSQWLDYALPACRTYTEKTG